jgi:type II secretory pathway component PulF
VGFVLSAGETAITTAMNESVSEKRGRANTLMTIVGTIAACGGVAVAHLRVPKFREVFVSFGAELPLLTRIFVEYPLVFWWLPLLVPVAASRVRIREPSDTRHGAIALSLGIAIAIGLPLICGFAMYLPIFKLTAVVG